MDLITRGVYVIKLENSKYYVGSSKCMNRRIRVHSSGEYSCAWVKLHPFRCVYALFPVEDDDTNLRQLEEDVVTDMIVKYGIDNVRGGSFTLPELSNEQRETILRIVTHRNDSCLKCGQNGHYMNACTNEKQSHIKHTGFWGFIEQGIIDVLSEARKKEIEFLSSVKMKSCDKRGRTTFVGGKIVLV